MLLSYRASEGMPVAHTCFFHVELPKYTSLEQARKMLGLTIKYGLGSMLIVWTLPWYKRERKREMANTFKYYNATCKHKTAFKKNIYIFLNKLIYVICDTCIFLIGVDIFFDF